MRFMYLGSLALAGMFLSGCSNTPTVTLDNYAGVYLTTDNSQSIIAVIRLNPCPPTAYITGYTYASIADAQKGMANGFPSGTGAGNPTGTIRGTLAYSDPTAKTHINKFNLTIQINPNGENWTAPAYAGTASFDSTLMIEDATASGSSTAALSGTWSKQD